MRNKVLRHEDGCTEGNCDFCRKRRNYDAWKARHPGRRQEQSRRSREKNKQKNQQYFRLYGAQNQDKLKVYYKEWYQKNKDRWKTKTLAYAATPERRVARNQRNAERYRTDKIFRLGHGLRSRFRIALKRADAKKMGQFERDLLGCSIAELRVHLEELFLPGMSWENYGPRGWHIDHKIPLAKFDLTKPEQQAAACNYTNLQPLWAKDNMAKGAR